MSGHERIAVIGGTGNLGAAIARRLAKAGRSVVIGSRSAESAAKSAAELGFGLAGMANGDAVPVRHGHFPASLRNAAQIIEMSTFDRQVIVAVDGHELFAPWPCEQSSKRKPLQQPVRIGAAGGEFTVQHLKLYRDVYYTPKGETDEHPLAKTLGDDEFYVLGDNSPVSVDSRVWDEPAVRRTALIGKPLVVHLPSQQGTLKWGGEIHHVRIPDFSRVRYIR